MIRIEQLAKHYGNTQVLRNINAEIQKGEVVSIIGPSGTGKSTLLRCLNLLEIPTSGRVLIDNENILDPRIDITRIRQKMNMVFQSFNLFAHLNVLDNLTLGPVRLRGISRSEAESKAMELLRLVGLAEKADHFPDELSGGQKQRVAIARCLAMEPEIILFDEPTSALDPTMISEVLSVIRRLVREGITLLIVTHELDFARDVSSRVFFMDEGIIYEEGTPEQIFTSPQREKTRAFINRIRSCHCEVTSTDYDLYRINAEIEQFCDKQIIPRQTRNQLLLLVEELLQLYTPVLTTSTLTLTTAYSEKTGSLQIIVDTPPLEPNPINGDGLDDELGLMLIRNLTSEIELNTDDPSRHQLCLTLNRLEHS